MPIAAVERYLENDERAPFFLALGDSNYESVKDDLLQRGFKKLATSDFCSDPDSVPNLDELFNTIRERNESDKIAVVGLGEYLALQGAPFAERALGRLKTLSFGRGKVVLLLRGLAQEIARLQQDDPRFDRRRYFIGADVKHEATFKFYGEAVESSSKSRRVAIGFKELLKDLESGAKGEICTKTRLFFSDSLYRIRRIESPYGAIKEVDSNFDVPEDCGRLEYWNRLASALDDARCDIEMFLKRKGLDESLETSLGSNSFQDTYENWLVFIALKYHYKNLRNSYLKRALNNSKSIVELKTELVYAIREIPHTQKTYQKLYETRKSLLRSLGVGDADMDEFVAENRIDLETSVYRLTDLTEVERGEIVSWYSTYGYVKELDYVYPALVEYLKPYTFLTDNHSENLTYYFETYKRLKSRNEVSNEFLELVQQNANARIYNNLPFRAEIIDKYNAQGESKVLLYWLDALGVEYLSFILERCRRRGLSASVNIARAQLPTITSLNQEFLENWRGDVHTDKRLDEVKHKESGGYDFCKEKKPTHLSKELQIIAEVIDAIKSKLETGDYNRVILVSDHGASRLAVLAGQEEKYDADTKGEHSGRCRKIVKSGEICDLPFATEENGWIVLANYGRFKGSRKANVEVHGGASLEEVVVPVISLTLRDDSVRIVFPEQEVVANFKQKARVRLFSKKKLNAEVSIAVYNAKGEFLGRYRTTTSDQRNFYATLDAVKRAGAITLKVFLGDELYKEEFPVSVQGGGVKKSSNGSDGFFDF